MKSAVFLKAELLAQPWVAQAGNLRNIPQFYPFWLRAEMGKDAGMHGKITETCLSSGLACLAVALAKAGPGVAFGEVGSSKERRLDTCVL
jgi:hypothetical protein